MSQSNHDFKSLPPWSPAAMKVAAISSMVSAVTTLLLIFLPNIYPPPQDFADRIALTENPWFQLRAWTYYVHPFLCFVAAVGIWRITRLHDRGLALLGLFAIAVWAYTEALQQALTNVGAGWNWFPAYAGADAAGRALIEERWQMFFGLWDGLYFLLLTGFLLAHLLFGLVLARSKGVDRIAGVGLLAVAALSLLNFSAGYGGPAWTGAVAGVAYPLLQPAVRFGLGLWIWRQRYVA